MHRRTVALTAALLLGSGLAGCGSEDDEQAIRGVLTELDQAKDESDAERACRDLVVIQEFAGEGSEAEGEGEGEKSEEEREREKEGGGGEESPAACERAFRRQVVSRRAAVKALRTEVLAVTVKDATATAKVRADVTRTDGSRFANEFERELVRRDGRWKVRISPEG